MIIYALTAIVSFALGCLMAYSEGKINGHTEGYLAGYEQCEQDIGIFSDDEAGREFEDLAGEDNDNV